MFGWLANWWKLFINCILNKTSNTWILFVTGKCWNVYTFPTQSTSPFTWTRPWPNSSPCIPNSFIPIAISYDISVSPSIYSYFTFKDSTFRKSKLVFQTLVIGGCGMHFRLPAAIGLRVLRYWDWSGVAEPEPVDRISFESANLLRCSTHPNPLASKTPSKIHFLVELAESTLSAVRKFWLNFHFVWFKCVQFHLRDFFLLRCTDERTLQRKYILGHIYRRIKYKP